MAFLSLNYFGSLKVDSDPRFIFPLKVKNIASSFLEAMSLNIELYFEKEREVLLSSKSNHCVVAAVVVGVVEVDEACLIAAVPRVASITAINRGAIG